MKKRIWLRIGLGVVAVLVLVAAGFWIYRIGYAQGSMSGAGSVGRTFFTDRNFDGRGMDGDEFQLFSGRTGSWMHMDSRIFASPLLLFSHFSPLMMLPQLLLAAVVVWLLIRGIGSLFHPVRSAAGVTPAHQAGPGAAGSEGGADFSADNAEQE